MSSICPIQGIDHLEFYVGNAKQSANFYANCFGFTPTAYQGLETGERKVTSYLLQQGDIRFLFTSSLTPDHPIAHSVSRHGDTIAVIALAVTDVAQLYAQAVKRGAIGMIPPTEQTDEHGVLRFAAIRSYGDTLIKFIDRQDYPDRFAPGFASQATSVKPAAGLQQIDHIVGNVEQGMMDHWAAFFMQVLDFDLLQQFDARTISTEYSALMSKVVTNQTRTVKLPINEPADGRRKSQIEEYLDFHYGPGIQHVALTTNNIVETIITLRRNGVEFLPIPQTYYDNLESWVQEIDVPVEQLARLGILVDRDEEGYLLQLFTNPVGDRPTLFFEIIERHGSEGFGAGNFKSLFVALEQEQARRGNL